MQQSQPFTNGRVGACQIQCQIAHAEPGTNASEAKQDVSHAP